MPENLKIHDENIPITIKKSPNRKRTLSFRMSEAGLTIQIPIKTKEDYLEKVITKRLNWIYKHWLNLKSVQIHKNQNSNKNSFYFRGEIYDIQLIKTDKKRPVFEFRD